MLLMLLCVTAAAPAIGQMHPQPVGTDPRIQWVQYDAGQVVRLHGAPGYPLTVQLAESEQVQNVSVGDSAAWQVSASGNQLHVKPVAAKPTTMTVNTGSRIYRFELLPVYYPSEAAHTVAFRYSQAQPAIVAAPDEFLPPRLPGHYRISGDKAVRPDSVRDDGRRTYLSWRADRPLPAVYAISDTGQEMLLDGMMRGDEMVIEGVITRLQFRIDRNVARANRHLGKKRR